MTINDFMYVNDAKRKMSDFTMASMITQLIVTIEKLGVADKLK